MNNQERQKSIEKSIKKEFGNFICYKRIFCCYCKKEEETPCAKAYNRMKRQTTSTIEREKYSWGDF